MGKKPAFVCIGHSIVNGFPHRRSECFVSQLREKLPQFDVINKGENGDTAVGVQRRFEHDALSKNPAYILIMTGTNDFILGMMDVDRMMKVLTELTEEANARGSKVIHLTPILCDSEKANVCWMPADYDSANANLMKVAERMKEYAETNEMCQVIDLQSAYLDFNEFLDGIHPTVEGHRFIADYIEKELLL